VPGARPFDALAEAPGRMTPHVQNLSPRLAGTQRARLSQVLRIMAGASVVRMFSAGLDQRRERRYFAACIVLCFAYVTMIAALGVLGTRIDTVFFTQRDALVLHKLLHFPLGMEQQVQIVQQGRLADPIALLRGWSIIEPWGVWTDGDEAQFALALPVPPPASPVLAIWAEIVRPQNGRQSIRLTSSGQVLAELETAEPRIVLCANLPAGMASRAPLRIVVNIGRPTRPPGGQDRRKLGLGLVRVELFPDRRSCERHTEP
jgi:hypothetical protein